MHFCHTALVAPIDSGTILPNLIFGVLIIAAGFAIIGHRHSLFRGAARDTKLFSRGASKAVGRWSSPFWIGAVGVSAIATGVFMIIGAVIGIVQTSV